MCYAEAVNRKAKQKKTENLVKNNPFFITFFNFKSFKNRRKTDYNSNNNFFRKVQVTSNLGAWICI